MNLKVFTVRMLIKYLKNIKKYILLLIFILFIIYTLNIVLQFLYVKKINYDIVIQNIQKIGKINYTKSKIKFGRIFKCVKIDKIFYNDSYRSITIFEKNKIKFGRKIIRNHNRVYITEQNNKTLYESYKIYFLKKIKLNQFGSIITSTNQFISLNGGCRCNKELNNLSAVIHITGQYSLVYQITQYLGSSVYHSIINCLTKIIPLFNAINHFSNSKIHIHKNDAIINYLKLLNIESDRLVYGNIYSYNIVMMDRVKCTSSIYTKAIIELRDLLLMNIHKKRIVRNNNKKSILFIKRLYTRRINNFNKIFQSLCQFYNNYTCKIYYPNTTFYDMVNMFSTSDIIFGPHGAGFTNIILSKKKVMIFEIIKENFPVLCFSTLSNILRYKYYGVYSFCDSDEKFNLNSTLIISYFNEQF